MEGATQDQQHLVGQGTGLADELYHYSFPQTHGILGVADAAGRLLVV